MPHFVVEYTDNLGAEARIGELLTRVNRVLLDQGGVFPAGGIRSRAVRLTEYAVADEAEDYAFVHAVLRIGSGRSAEVKQRVGDRIFAEITGHFADLSSRRYLALSFEFGEFGEDGTWKQNNIHARFKKA